MEKSDTARRLSNRHTPTDHWHYSSYYILYDNIIILQFALQLFQQVIGPAYVHKSLSFEQSWSAMDRTDPNFRYDRRPRLVFDRTQFDDYWIALLEVIRQNEIVN